MGKYEELIRQVKNLISTNKTGKALEILAKEQLTSLDKDLIILNSRYSKVKEDQRLGVIDDDLAQRRINTINRDLLDLSEKIRKTQDSKIASIPPVKSASPTPLKIEKTFNKLWVIVPLLILVVALGIFMMIPKNSDTNKVDTPLDPPVEASFDWKCLNNSCNAPCEVQFTSNSKNASEFIWDFGDGQTSTLSNPTHKYMEDKTYTVKLTAIGETTNDKKTESIQINPSPPPPPGEKPLPIANFKMDKTTCIAPCKITFENLSKNATKYTWEVNSKRVSGERNLKHDFKSPGKYSINLIAISGSKKNAYQQYIKIEEAVKPPRPETPETPTTLSYFKPNPKTVYQIVSIAKKTSLQPDNIKKDGANIKLGSSSSEASHFNFTSASGDYFFINNISSEKRVVVYNASINDGAGIIQWKANNNDNERFKLEKLPNSNLLIINKKSGKALDVSGAGLTQRTINRNNTNQQFKLIKAKPKVASPGGEFNPKKHYRLTSKWQGEGKAIDVINNSDKNPKVALANSAGYSGQYWKITKLGNGYYRLTTAFKGDGKSLDVINENGWYRPQLVNTGNSPGQYWKITKLDKDYYRLTTKLHGDGKSLDVINDGGQNNNLHLINTANPTGQYWKITEIK